MHSDLLDHSKNTKAFNFRSNEPSPDGIGPLVRYDHPWEKKQSKNNKTSKHTSVIFLLIKKNNISADRSLKSLLSTSGFSDALKLTV